MYSEVELIGLYKSAETYFLPLGSIYRPQMQMKFGVRASQQIAFLLNFVFGLWANKKLTFIFLIDLLI